MRLDPRRGHPPVGLTPRHLAAARWRRWQHAVSVRCRTDSPAGPPAESDRVGPRPV